MTPSNILLNNPNFKTELGPNGEIISLLGKVFDSSVPTSEGFTLDGSASIRAFREYARRDVKVSELMHVSDLYYNRTEERLLVADERWVGAKFTGLVDVDITASGVVVWFGMELAGPMAEFYEQTLNGYPGATLVARIQHGSDSLAVDSAGEVVLGGADPRRRAITAVYGVDLVVYQRTEQIKEEVKRANSVVMHPGLLDTDANTLTVENVVTRPVNIAYSDKEWPNYTTQSEFVLDQINRLVHEYMDLVELGHDVPSHLTIVTSSTMSHILHKALTSQAGDEICKMFTVDIHSSLNEAVYLLFGGSPEVRTEYDIRSKEKIMIISMYGNNLKAS